MRAQITLGSSCCAHLGLCFSFAVVLSSHRNLFAWRIELFIKTLCSCFAAIYCMTNMLSTSEARCMNVSDLRAELEGLGLNKQRTKPPLLARLLISIEDTSSSSARELCAPSATAFLQRAQEQEKEQHLESIAAASPSSLVPGQSRNDNLRQFVRQEVHSAITVALSEATAPMLATITAPGSGT